MEKRNELLINYIKNALYHPEKAQLNPGDLSGEDRELAEWVQKLGGWMIEAGALADAVAEGREPEPLSQNQENTLVASIQNIQNRFSRMTDQIGRVVQSKDSDQHQDESASLNFDDMVLELQKRTSALENERNLFVKFTESASERIIVLDEESGEMVYANKIAREFFEKTKNYIDSADDINQLSGCTYLQPYNSWLHTVVHPGENTEKVEYYQVHSIYIIWEGRGAVAHKFLDVTEAKETERLAMKDALTGAFSRSYGMDYINRIFEAGKCFSLAFVDVDYLKYCNDTYGHEMGDEYIKRVVSLLRRIDDEATVCRTGGDEFLVISEELREEELRERIEAARQELNQECFPNKKIYKNFSYGITARTAGKTTSVKELISRADEYMYMNKLENKKNNHMSIN